MQKLLHDSGYDEKMSPPQLDNPANLVGDKENGGCWAATTSARKNLASNWAQSLPSETGS